VGMMNDMGQMLGREITACPERMIEEVARYLHVRDREGKVGPLKANRAQQAFERARGNHNIVLKARQMGITTWVAARFFLKTITAPGVLTVQVAQTREAAQGIFRMVQRFWENLPKDLREGTLRRGRANVGMMTFPELDSEFRILSAADPGAGRGLTIQNLHLSEVSRWPGNAGETLAGLRAALSPGGEMVMESTPNGAFGCFYEEWGRAESNGTVRHFFPWWLEDAYVSTAVTDMTEEELRLVDVESLSAQQIGFRRTLEASYHGLRRQEFAEDPESCFKASGECCFEIEAIERRLAEAPDPFATRRDGALEIWLPPLRDKEYLVAVDTAGGRAHRRLLGRPGDRCGDGSAMCRTAQATGNAGSGAGRVGTGARVPQRDDRGGAEQSRRRSAGASRQRRALRSCLREWRRCGIPDISGQQAFDGGTHGRAPGAVAAALPEQAPSARVPILRDPAGRWDRRSERSARRLPDGDGHSAGGESRVALPAATMTGSGDGHSSDGESRVALPAATMTGSGDGHSAGCASGDALRKKNMTEVAGCRLRLRVSH
jgi:hypothetical protein